LGCITFPNDKLEILLQPTAKRIILKSPLIHVSLVIKMADSLKIAK
jgi:hypothetical protein